MNWSINVPMASARIPAMAVGQILRAHDFGALLVDDLALIISDVIEQQQLLSDVEVV